HSEDARRIRPRGQSSYSSAVRTAFNWAVNHDRLLKSPFKKVKKLKAEKEPEIDFLNRDERDKLLEACEAPVPFHGPGGKGKKTRDRITPIYAIVAVAVFAGLRLLEILNLAWTDVDFKKKELIVRSKPNFRTKTGKDRRVPLFPDLEEILKPLRSKDGLCFQTRNGTGYQSRNIHRELKRVASKLGAREKPVNFVTLRHTFATQLVSSGISIYAVSKWLGHASVKTTEKHYAAFVPDEMVVEQAAEALARSSE
ncbi:tyrosine-type recombinase/integrase, partial [Planctomycetota bacterium]